MTLARRRIIKTRTEKKARIRKQNMQDRDSQKWKKKNVENDKNKIYTH